MGCCTEINDEVKWEDFVVPVAAFAKNAPTEMIAYHAREATTIFLRKSKALKRRVFVDLQENVNDYIIEVDDDYRIISIASVYVMGSEIPHDPRGWPAGKRGYTVFEHNHIVIPNAPACDIAGGMIVEVYVYPGPKSCSVDAELYNLYSDALADGVISRLLRMPEAPWYNVKDWRTYDNSFRKAYIEAKVLADRDYVQGPVRMTKRRFI